jgi:hypothetical protein
MKSNIPSTSIKRPQRPAITNFHYNAITVACCVVLVAGFFLAARQHFSSMEYGLQNSRLRQQLDELQSEKRKLLVTREVSMSPIELRKAVRRIGFMDTPPSQLDAVKVQNSAVQRPIVNAVKETRPTSETPGKVMKTVISAPVVRSPILEKQARRENTSGKKDRT